MKYKAVLWDLDGTLLDTLEDLFLSVNAALSACGLPPRSRDFVRMTTGHGIRHLMEHCVPEGSDVPTTECAFAAFKEHYDAHCRDHTGPYPGVIDMLRQYREMGGRSAIVSNKADFAVQKLAAENFPDLVDTALGATDGRPKKPAPDMSVEAMRRLGVEPQETLYVGDSEVDWQTAQMAGLDGAFVTWGFRTPEQLRQIGAVLLFDDPQTLMAYILE